MTEQLKAREGDFLETKEYLIFDVKGLIHPPDRVIAYLRYYPDSKGDRIKRNQRFSKIYPISDRYDFLRKFFPQYLFYDSFSKLMLQAIPLDCIKKRYDPAQRLKDIMKKGAQDSIEKDVVAFSSIIREASGISVDKLGISGSILVGLHKDESDIDIVVYGSENCWEIYEALEHLADDTNGPIRKYDEKGLRNMFDFRAKGTPVSFRDFVKYEKRKRLQGYFNTRDFFIRFIKDWGEISEEYGDFSYESVGRCIAQGIVIDESEAVFTPCKYILGKSKVISGVKVKAIREIVSYRGRFCEQARTGEKVSASGKIELVKSKDGEEYYRLLLGGNERDFMVLLES
ncbi:MAG: nucleotidyltransferase domain-containing protein [Candidatus Hodarchaeota archaeon]